MCSTNFSQRSLVNQESRLEIAREPGLWRGCTWAVTQAASCPSLAFWVFVQPWCDRKHTMQNRSKRPTSGSLQETRAFSSENIMLRKEHHATQWMTVSMEKKNQASPRPLRGTPSLGGDKIMNNVLVFQFTGRWLVHRSVYFQA